MTTYLPTPTSTSYHLKKKNSAHKKNGENSDFENKDKWGVTWFLLHGFIKLSAEMHLTWAPSLTKRRNLEYSHRVPQLGNPTFGNTESQGGEWSEEVTILPECALLSPAPH